MTDTGSIKRHLRDSFDALLAAIRDENLRPELAPYCDRLAQGLAHPETIIERFAKELKESLVDFADPDKRFNGKCEPLDKVYFEWAGDCCDPHDYYAVGYSDYFEAGGIDFTEFLNVDTAIFGRKNDDDPRTERELCELYAQWRQLAALFLKNLLFRVFDSVIESEEFAALPKKAAISFYASEHEDEAELVYKHPITSLTPAERYRLTTVHTAENHFWEEKELRKSIETSTFEYNNKDLLYATDAGQLANALRRVISFERVTLGIDGLGIFLMALANNTILRLLVEGNIAATLPIITGFASAAETLEIDMDSEDYVNLLGNALCCVKDSKETFASITEKLLPEAPITSGILAFNLACAYAVHGPVEKAFAYIEIALRLGYPKSAFQSDDWFDSLREDPGFIELTREA